MALYMLDTNILSDAIKNPLGSCAQRMASEPAECLCTSIVVSAELRFGAEKKGSVELSRRVEQLLNAIEVIAFGPGADNCYAKVRCILQQRGTLIDANDMLIAAHAIALDAVLVTDNTAEFARVDDLQIQNWLLRT